MGVYKRKPDGPYYIDYYTPEGRKRESAKTYSKKEAERCLQSRLGDVRQGRYKLQDRKKAVSTLKSFSDEYLMWAKANKRSWQRDEYSLKHLLPFFGNCRLSGIKLIDVGDYRIRRKKEVKFSTVNREIACLKHILNFAVESGVISENPIAGFKLEKEPTGMFTVLTVEEINRLIESCSGIFRAIVITAIYTGIRKSWILQLKWSDVNLDLGYIRLGNPDDKRTKNGEIQYVRLNDTMIKMLNGLPKTSQYVFTQQNGKPFTCPKYAWNKARKKAGLSCRFHDLRHTFASHLAMSGTPPGAIQNMLGHKTSKMVQVYSHFSDAFIQQEVQKLDTKFLPVTSWSQEQRHD